MTVEKLSNGCIVSLAYDAGSRLVRLANLKSDRTTLSSFLDTWDSAGNRTSRVEANGDRVTFAYDATYQLQRERRSGANAYDTTYLYDAGGNRRAKIDSAARTTSVYDGANQLRYSLDATGSTTYTFDATGNQLVTLTPAGARTTNTWDFENRLTRVKLPTGVTNTMVYNADNLRVQKIDSTGTSKFIWDGHNVLMETDAANASNAVYTARPTGYGSMLSQRRKSGAVWTPSYYHFDQLGTVAALTSSAQATTDTYKYRAFGESLATTGTTKNAFRYVGALQYYFDSDLAQYYVRRRVYLPTIARWFSADPLGLVDGLNRYTYSTSRPQLRTDPSGRISIIEVASNYDRNAKCGDSMFAHYIFQLDFPAPCDGYIVQKVEAWCYQVPCGIIGKIQTCNCPTYSDLGVHNVVPDLLWWEAWYVKSGNRIPQFSVQEGDEGIEPNAIEGDRGNTLNFNDNFSSKAHDYMCGAYFARGTIRFVCKELTGDLGRAGRPNPQSSWKIGKSHSRPNGRCTGTSGTLPATEIEPWWWGPINWKLEEAEAYRDVTLEWQCCHDANCPQFVRASANSKLPSTVF